MDTFEKEFGKFVVSFNNENEYVEMGPLYESPKFAGVGIREKFSTKYVGLDVFEIKFFLGELIKITGFDKEKPLVEMIHRYGWNNYSSDMVLVVSDYHGVRCRFFMGISHQYNFPDAIETNSPEFSLEEVLEILGEAYSLCNT
jgi:hypothetical protein